MKKFFKAPPDPVFSYVRLPDAKAIYAYLKAIPAIANKVDRKIYE